MQFLHTAGQVLRNTVTILRQTFINEGLFLTEFKSRTTRIISTKGCLHTCYARSRLELQQTPPFLYDATRPVAKQVHLIRPCGTE